MLLVRAAEDKSLRWPWLYVLAANIYVTRYRAAKRYASPMVVRRRHIDGAAT